jgi:spermidine synthase
MLLVLVTLGFSSIIGQVVLMRELVVIFFGNELVFGLILAWWLLWEAMGAWGLGRWADRHDWGRRALGLTLTFAAFALPIEIAVSRLIRDLMGVTPGAIVPLEQVFWTVGLILAPYCLAHGTAFFLGAKLLGGNSAGPAYALESAGAVVGGALFSFVLINHLDAFQAILLVATVTLVTVVRLPSSASMTPFGKHGLAISGLAFIAGIALALPLGAWLHQTTLKQQWPRLVFSEDSRYGRLTITALGDQRAFFENGLLVFETESTLPEEVVHLPMLAHPDPQRVLLLGGGVSGDLTELFKYSVAELVYLELDPLVIKAAQDQLPAEQANILKEPRLRLINKDGRYYAKQAREKFDVVILDLPEPSTGQLNRFYTLEFFQEVKPLLSAGGIFTLGLPSAENYWSPELARRNASVYHTLRQVFATVLVTPGDHNHILATTASSFPDATELGDRLRARGITTRWVTPVYIDFLLTGDRFNTVLAELEEGPEVKLNRDLSPICYFYDLALWVSRFGSGLRGLFETTSLLRLSWLAFPLIIGLIALWGRRRATGMALVGGTGFSAMTLQIVLILAFQALYGYVYQQVGLLVTAFMAGLALGAGMVSRQQPAVNCRWLTVIQGGLLVYALALALALPKDLPAPELTFPILAGVAGALAGAVFPLAAVSYRAGETSRVAGLLYGADLLGGCVGAVATSTILVPVLGVVQTCLAVALIAGAGMLLALCSVPSHPC